MERLPLAYLLLALAVLAVFLLGMWIAWLVMH
jgi:hypothetical protein